MLLYLKNILSIIRIDYREKKSDRRHRKNIPSNSIAEKYATDIRKNGFTVIENFWSADRCEKAKKEIDEIILKYPDKIDVDPEGSDHRIWGAERISPLVREFHEDSFLFNIAEAYTKTSMVNHMSLAAKLVYGENNKGSGGGWHRDSAYEQQFKSILYLSDVEAENGPYEYLLKTHKLMNVLRSFNFEKAKRFSQEDLERFVKKYAIPIQTVTAKTGTLVLTDTRGIHRGKPIQNGARYALTNYFVGVHRQERFKEHFDSLIKFPISPDQ